MRANLRAPDRRGRQSKVYNSNYICKIVRKGLWCARASTILGKVSPDKASKVSKVPPWGDRSERLAGRKYRAATFSPRHIFSRHPLAGSSWRSHNPPASRIIAGELSDGVRLRPELRTNYCGAVAGRVRYSRLMTDVGVESIPQIERRSSNHREAVERRPSKQRSRLSNGSKLLPATDGRSVTARRFKDLIEFICVDLGGADRLSEGERQLVRRAAALSAECERQEALWARGEAEFDIAAYSTLTSTVRRVFETLGLKRVPRNVTPFMEGVAASSPAPDLTQLSNSQLDRLYALLAEARESGFEALRKVTEEHEESAERDCRW